MVRYSWPGMFAAACALMVLSPDTAEAKGIALITRGDTVTELGTPTGSAGRKIMDGKVAYKYSYIGLFWVDFWTSDGTFCTISGDTYDPISKAEAAALLGKKEDELSVPFWYRVPLGWIVGGGILALVVVGKVMSKGKPSEEPAPQQAAPST